MTLHSNGVKDIAKTEEALVIEAEEKINASLSKIGKVASKARQLYTSSLDCEVDTQITTKDGEQRIRTVQVRRALSRYQEIESERSKKLAQLWISWEKTQSDVDELSNKLRVLFERGPSKGTSGISSNHRRADMEDHDIDLRSKQVVEDMTACEEVRPSLNPDPTRTSSLKS